MLVRLLKQNTRHILAITSFMLLTAHCAQAAVEDGFVWPNGAKAAVNLAYDDSLNSQLDIAIPQLDKYGFKGSFYLRLDAPTLKNRLNEWRQAAANGHELGNHTIYHPCRGSKPNREWVIPYHDLDTYKLDEIHQEIDLANTLLHAIDGRTERTYTLPCGDTLADGKDYVAGIKDKFLGIKVVGGSVPDTMQAYDMGDTGVWAPSEQTADQLIDFVKQAKQKGTMANFTFHGIGGDYLTTSAEAHEALLAYLAKNKSDYWVATFADISRYVRQQQAKSAHE